MSVRFEEKYQLALKRRVIEDFVKENQRSPSFEQLNELMRLKNIAYPSVNTRGFTSQDTEVPYFQIESSASIENVNRKAHFDDINTINEKIIAITELMEDSFRGFKSTCNRANKMLSGIDARLNNLLLLSGRTDVFVYGIEETFDTADFIDFENSTTTHEPGFVTLGRDGYTNLDTADMSFDISSFSDKGILFSRSTSSLRAIAEADGDIWEHFIYTASPTAKVNMTIDVDFKNSNGIYLGDLRLNCNPTNANSKTYMTVFYSVDGQTYHTVNPPAIEVTSGPNQCSVGIDGVKKIRILLRKKAADDIENGRGIYIFSIDSMEFFTDEYIRSPHSTLYAGPYFITDERDQPINFTMATLAEGSCCVLPDKTSVNYWLSKDKINWIPISFNGKSSEIITFNTTNPYGTYEYIEESLPGASLITSNDVLPDLVDITYGDEAFCNLYITSEWADKFILQTAAVKRNLPQKGRKLYGVSSGWFMSPDKSSYKCAFYIESLEGMYMDFGVSSAIIDGSQVTGTVHLKQGYHTFETSSTNWYELDEELLTSIELEAADPAYPFNHKYMIEGYPYDSEYSGEKVYTGVDDYFGSLLEYVSPERFNDDIMKGNLDIYTIENYDGNLYFKVKIDSSDSSYSNEFVEPEYMIRTEDTNTLYIKALLISRDQSVSPRIEKINIRVI